MKKKYDVIIIGSGCGGAAAAALTSYLGMKTLLLEKNPFVGGRASTQEIQGFKMDYCHITARGAAGTHGRILRMVDCGDLVPAFKNIFYMKLFGLAFGQKINITDDIKEGVMSVGLTGLNYLLEGFLPPLEIPGIMMILYQFLMLTPEQTHKWDDVDLETFIRRYSKAEITNSLFGTCSCLGFGVLPRETSAGVFIRAMQGMINVPYDMISYPVNGEGFGGIVNSYIRAAERYKADIELRSPVKKIVVEDNEAIGVIVNGEIIKSNMIICNSGIRETAYNLIGKENLPAEYLKYISSLKYGSAGICLKYALDKPVVRYEFGGVVPPDFERNMSDALEGRIPKGLACMTMCPSNIDPSLAPPGKQVMVAVTPGPTAEVGSVDWEPWVENFRSYFEKHVVPGVAEHTIFCNVVTPDAIAMESGRTLTDGIGSAQSIDQAVKNVPPMFAPVKGVYQVGSDIGMNGIGTEMAAQSAIDLIAELDKRELIRRKREFKTATRSVKTESGGSDIK